MPATPPRLSRRSGTGESTVPVQTSRFHPAHGPPPVATTQSTRRIPFVKTASAAESERGKPPRDTEAFAAYSGRRPARARETSPTKRESEARRKGSPPERCNPERPAPSPPDKLH